jgi:hypothetical protein
VIFEKPLLESIYIADVLNNLCFAKVTETPIVNHDTFVRIVPVFPYKTVGNFGMLLLT